MPSSPRQLLRLRREIEVIDRALLGAIRRRLDRARAAGKFKARTGQPLRDFATEKRVLARWQKGLASAGVSSARAEALGRWLIEEAIRIQEPVRPKHRRRSREGFEVAIVGGAGAMGSWLGDFLEDQGHSVAVVDRQPPASGRATLPDVDTAAQRADVLIFATPIRSTAPLLRRAIETGTDALLFDVLSVKAPILPLLQRAARAGRRVTSVHPMFGPSARTLSGRNLLIVSCGVPTADRAARALFAGSALTLTEVPLERHDLLVAGSLGLSHAINLLFLASLAVDPLSSSELASAASTTFHRQSSLARAVASEGSDLYLDIQALNPHSWGVYQEIRAALDRLQVIVERHDGAGFRELLDSGRSKLDPGPEAMRA